MFSRLGCLFFKQYWDNRITAIMLVVKAVHTFVAEHSDELEFEAGDEIEVLEKDDAFGDGWWRVSSLPY